LANRANECAVEWEESKNLLNQKKHRVSFEEAATIFADPLEIIVEDPDNSLAEHRFISIGRVFVAALAGCIIH
jgi:uncharacterized DUF497 family protein